MRRQCHGIKEFAWLYRQRLLQPERARQGLRYGTCTRARKQCNLQDNRSPSAFGSAAYMNFSPAWPMHLGIECSPFEGGKPVASGHGYFLSSFFNRARWASNLSSAFAMSWL
jgi:hypothetical protein